MLVNIIALSLAFFSGYSSNKEIGISVRDKRVLCKRSEKVILPSIISTEDEAKDLFLRLAGKIDGGAFKNREYYLDVKFTKGFWTIYGEDVTDYKDKTNILGSGGLFLSVDACTGRVNLFRYTR